MSERMGELSASVQSNHRRSGFMPYITDTLLYFETRERHSV